MTKRETRFLDGIKIDPVGQTGSGYDFIKRSIIYRPVWEFINPLGIKFTVH